MTHLEPTASRLPKHRSLARYHCANRTVLSDIFGANRAYIILKQDFKNHVTCMNHVTDFSASFGWEQEECWRHGNGCPKRKNKPNTKVCGQASLVSMKPVKTANLTLLTSRVVEH